MSPLNQLEDYGQSVWYDNIQRSMLGKGNELERLISEDSIRGITTNPAIFEKAINGSNDYDQLLLKQLKISPQATSRDLFFGLAIDDIQQAADQLLGVYMQSDNIDGYVSLEVSPDLAYDTKNTTIEARRLVERVNRPNLMIKIPATKEGIPAIETLTSDGININATLLFSVDRYEEVARAYINGLRARLKRGLPVDHIASVASFFVSRVDASVDQLLAEKAQTATDLEKFLMEKLAGRTAIANAQSAYTRYHQLYREEFHDLDAAGAQPQRLLWASTGVKNPGYSDVLYANMLIGQDTVNTLPPATYRAFKDHGTATATLEQFINSADSQLKELAELGIDLANISQQLEDDGVKQFEQAFHTVLNAIETKVNNLNKPQQATA